MYHLHHSVIASKLVLLLRQWIPGSLEGRNKSKGLERKLLKL